MMQRYSWAWRQVPGGRVEGCQDNSGEWVRYADAEAELELERSFHMGREREVRAAVEKERDEVIKIIDDWDGAVFNRVSLMTLIRSRGEQKPGKRIERLPLAGAPVEDKLNEVIDAVNSLREAKS